MLLSPLLSVEEATADVLFLVLTAGGPGIHDPCEREPTDVLCDLSAQQADTITGSAQVRAAVLRSQWEGAAEPELSLWC